MSTTPANAVSPRLAQLVRKLGNDKYRMSYLSARLKAFLANQIRALRGDKSQAEFGKRIGKPQSVISRIEDPEYGNLSVQTLLDIAEKLSLALIIQFVDWPTFLRFTEETASNPLAPEPFDQSKIDALIAPQAVAPPLPATVANNPVSAWNHQRGGFVYTRYFEQSGQLDAMLRFYHSAEFEDVANAQAVNWHHLGRNLMVPGLPTIGHAMGQP